MILGLALLLLYVIIVFCKQNEQNEPNSVTNRIYGMKKCGGAGCPYTASWLAHVNLYRKITWYLDSTKMEAASFNIFDKAKLKFQLTDPDAYYVHHMSMFEHLNHKKYGFEDAKNKTIRMSRAAYHGECDNLSVSRSKEYIALVPFYGGRPPGVTKDLAVKSIGQGNSLVDSFTKALQTMATVCSCLKYFRHVIVGVARDEDRILVLQMLQEKLTTALRRHVNVVQLQMTRPAHLPFHLLAWGQQYVKQHNCKPFYNNANVYDKSKEQNELKQPEKVNNNETDSSANVTANTTAPNIHYKQLHQNTVDYHLDFSKIPTSTAIDGGGTSAYDICHPNAIARSIGAPINVTYMKHSSHHIVKQSLSHYHHQQQNKHFKRRYLKETTNKIKSYGNAATRNSSSVRDSSNIKHNNSSDNSSNEQETLLTRDRSSSSSFHPIKYIYYTECDQIVKFDSFETLSALTAASNDTTFFVGRRKEKARESNPQDYLGSLNIWRECGSPGYSLSWPTDNKVRID